MANRNLPAFPLSSYTESNHRVTGLLYGNRLALPAIRVRLRQTDVGEHAAGEFTGHRI